MLNPRDLNTKALLNLLLPASITSQHSPNLIIIINLQLTPPVCFSTIIRTQVHWRSLHSYYYRSPSWCVCLFAGERISEEADGGSRRRWAPERRHQEHARGPRQAGGRDLPTRGQGQERLHQPRGVLRPQARRALSYISLSPAICMWKKSTRAPDATIKNKY